MITETIIKKLGLKATDHTTGNSWANKLRIFEWPDLCDQNYMVYVMECEVDGEKPKEDAAIFVVRGALRFKWCRMTIEFIEDVDAPTIQQAMQYQLSKCPDLPHHFRPKRLITIPPTKRT